MNDDFTVDNIPAFSGDLMSMVRRGEFDRTLRRLWRFTNCILEDSRANGFVLAHPLLDATCMEAGAALASKHGITKSQHPSARRDVYLVTELLSAGGHSRVLADIVEARGRQKALVIATNVNGNHDHKAAEMLLAPLDAEIELLAGTSFEDKAIHLLDRLARLAPENITVLSNHGDSVAIQALQPSLLRKAEYYHHCDHNFALGVTLSHLTHIDVSQRLFSQCPAQHHSNGKHVYWPITANVTRFRNPGDFLKRTGPITTASSGNANKYLTNDRRRNPRARSGYLYSYFDLVAPLLRATGGRHIHIGPLPQTLREEIYQMLANLDIGMDRFIHVPWVPALADSLVDYGVDLYISSFPIGGGRAVIEAGGAGIPILQHRNYQNSLLSGGATHLGGFFWDHPEEMLEFLRTVDAQTLARLAGQVRENYVTYHSPNVLKRLVDQPIGEEGMPPIIENTDALQDFIDRFGPVEVRIPAAEMPSKKSKKPRLWRSAKKAARRFAEAWL
ncbi:MAG TPA: glycosyltransferase [Dongiaceae bacterium]|nr:glycosyltransferase [Dongiaceae bacterium]